MATVADRSISEGLAEPDQVVVFPHPAESA